MADAAAPATGAWLDGKRRRRPPHAGGNVAPTLLILTELRRRGHEVVVLGHHPLGDVVAAHGLTFASLRHARPWAAIVEQPGARSMAAYLTLASDRGIGRDLAALAAEARPDLVLVDCMVPRVVEGSPSDGRSRGRADAHPHRILGVAVGPTVTSGLVAESVGGPPRHRGPMAWTWDSSPPIPSSTRFLPGRAYPGRASGRPAR